MSRVLITGGNGLLGRALTPPLMAAGYTVRVASRSPRSPNAIPNVEWVQTSFETGEGLEEAVAGSSVIIHCATSFSKVKQVDVEGTQRLLTLAQQHGVQHFIYTSIIGADRIPFSYLQCKVEAEQLIAASGIPYSILRPAQFYGGFIAVVLKAFTKLPIGLIPKGFIYQPIDVGEVVDYTVELVKAGPSNCVVDMVGPHTYTLADLARTWLQAQGKQKPLLQIPFPGKFAAAMRAGYATVPEKSKGGLTWEEWLRREYGTGS